MDAPQQGQSGQQQQQQQQRSGRAEEDAADDEQPAGPNPAAVTITTAAAAAAEDPKSATGAAGQYTTPASFRTRTRTTPLPPLISTCLNAPGLPQLLSAKMALLLS